MFPVTSRASRSRQELPGTTYWSAHRYHVTARAATDADPVFRRLWEQGAKDELPRAEAWLEQTGPAIAARLTETTRHRYP